MPKKFKDMPNKEMSEMIEAYLTCKDRDCAECPCNEIICWTFAYSADKWNEMLFEVSKRLAKE